MRALDFMLVMWSFVSCWLAAGVVPEVNPIDLESEAGVRHVLRHTLPKSEAAFYFYDGEQVFGVFVDPTDPKEVLLLVVPDGSVIRWTYKENGEARNVRRTPNVLAAVFRDPKTGERTGESYVAKLGTILTVPRDGEIELSFEIRQIRGDWILSASRSEDGKWRGTMRKTRATELIPNEAGMHGMQ